MSSPEAVNVGQRASLWPQAPVRVAFVGSEQLLDAFAPAAPVYGLQYQRIRARGAPGVEPAGSALKRFRPHVTVIFDPPSIAEDVELEAIGTMLGVLVDGVRGNEGISGLPQLDRLVSFDPSLTGERIEGQVVWRSMPPPVSDAYFAQVRPLHRAPRAMSLGASSEHREAILMPAKHHYDVLQLIHGVSGRELVQLLSEYDVGLYVARDSGGGFGHEALVHLAAGQLLIADATEPAYGLERNIDYLHVSSADELVWFLERLGRFPEMYQRIRMRGRLKAEQYRASRLFKRVICDLMLDTRAFGTSAEARA